mmetsp:Transcript_9411/g.11285  ORF Transcript_9411/g.11285 Transcript_9411/m.11285 type:complete len:629 (+) Transcript_9411:228-2114(+)|eukprot:CAMPEP_0184028794 /NCGR_PEP_ID=MMETSP0954-20121128/15054_1 /TAXON_ID=627963 /ORGANISM="Aplanochytrium sp, Strain PBS07" /LENGTH=628 /DNA_ID=CAMNT_0026313709 /DNA_START=221 /DNA_END=2107 /DNA_ORIENTATION=-
MSSTDNDDLYRSTAKPENAQVTENGVRKEKKVLRLVGGGSDPEKEEFVDARSKSSKSLRRGGQLKKTIKSETVANLQTQAEQAFNAVLKLKNMIPRNVKPLTEEDLNDESDDDRTDDPGVGSRATEALSKELIAKDKEIKELTSQLNHFRKIFYEAQGELKKAREAQERLATQMQMRMLKKKASLNNFSARRFSAARLSGSRISVSSNDQDQNRRRFGTFTEIDMTKQRTSNVDDDEDEDVLRLEKIDSQSLKKLQVKPRTNDLAGRVSGFRLLLESDVEDDKADLKTITDGFITIPHLTKMQVKLKWRYEPGAVLIIKKLNDEPALRMLMEIANYFLKKGNNITVFIERPVVEDLAEINMDLLENMTPLESKAMKHQPIDFVICLGGDGTLIWTCSLFPDGIPPICSFKMGSLGFLSPFHADDYEDTLNAVLTKGTELTIRSRLEIRIERASKEGEEPDEPEIFTCLNEAVIDRGPHQSMVQLNMYSGEKKDLITVVQGDGIIIATPTGSTAYSLAAGGGILHPAIPGMIVTPIAPHTLSFRPIIVSDSTFLMFEVSETARNSAFIAFDGQNQTELRKGDKVRILVSEFPVAAFCKEGETGDWFGAIKDSFLWNERSLQKSHSLTKK